MAVIFVIQRDLVTRYQCSVEKKKAELWMETATESSTLARRRTIARGAIERLSRCIQNDPSDFEALFLLAVARSEAGQKEAALQTFEAALDLNERPEIYASIGVLHLEAGRPAEALRNLLPAAYFNLYLARDVVAPALAWDLYVEAEKRQQRLTKAGLPTPDRSP